MFVRLKKNEIYYTVAKTESAGYVKTPMMFIGVERGIYKFRCLLTKILILVKDDMIHYCNAPTLSEEIEICKQNDLPMFSTPRPLFLKEDSSALMLTDSSFVKLVPSVEALFLGYSKVFHASTDAISTYKGSSIVAQFINLTRYIKAWNSNRKLKKEMWRLLRAF